MMPVENTKPGRRVGIVIPWFGRDLRGGAELHAWELASRLSARGHDVEVITTCCRAHQADWSTNYHEPGVVHEPEGFSIRRFRVGARDQSAFDQVNAKLIATTKAELIRGVSPLSATEEGIFIDELIRSPDLLAYLAADGASFAAILFLPYLYFSTLRGVPLVADKAILVPCLHHESYAFLPEVARAFERARKILFLAEGEAELALRLFGPGIHSRSLVAGAGVDFSISDRGVEGPHRSIDQPFVLCLGRQDLGKNTLFLVRAFVQFKERYPESRLALVLAGPGSIPLPEPCRDVVNLGLVSESQKAGLLAGCLALLAPSANESYSRVLMEAWHHGRPAIVHGDCLATATAVERSGGGWTATSFQDWVDAFRRITEAEVSELALMGANGTRYLATVGSWDVAIARYEAAISEVASAIVGPTKLAGRPIHQVLSNLAYGDAISNEALWIRDSLRELGHPSEIYALDRHPRVQDRSMPWSAGCLSPDDAIIYHHSIGSAVTQQVCQHPGPKGLIYHNITPAHFFAPYLPMHERLCQQGREHLPRLAEQFGVSVGDSTYNALELAEQGFANPGVLPLCIDPDKWRGRPDPEKMQALHSGDTNIIFVGRLCPNKRQEHLIAAFAHYVRIDPKSRLHLVGTPVTPNDKYEACLRQLVDDLKLTDRVSFTGHVDDAQLAAYYATAHLFWSMSEHEGFCIPLIEAMWFDVPVLAFAACAVPETVGLAGRLFTTKDDLSVLAEVAFKMIRDPKTRREIIAAQRVRREAFLPARVRKGLAAFVERICAHSKVPITGSLPALDTLNEIALVATGPIEALALGIPISSALRQRAPRARITLLTHQDCISVADEFSVDAIETIDAPWMSGTIAHPTFSEQTSSSVPRRYDLVLNLGYDRESYIFAATLRHRHLLSCGRQDGAQAVVSTAELLSGHGLNAAKQAKVVLDSLCIASYGIARFNNSSGNPEANQRNRNIGAIVLVIHAETEADRWPVIEFRELARRLRQGGSPVLLVGAESDRLGTLDWAEEYGCGNLCGELTLRTFAELATCCACVVSSTSRFLQVALCVDAPIVQVLPNGGLVRYSPSPVSCHRQWQEEMVPSSSQPENRTISSSRVRWSSVDATEAAVRQVLAARQIVDAKHPESAMGLDPTSSVRAADFPTVLEAAPVAPRNAHFLSPAGVREPTGDCHTPHKAPCLGAN